MNNINKTIKGVSLLTDINLALESGHIIVQGIIGTDAQDFRDHSGRWQGTEGSDAGCWFHH